MDAQKSTLSKPRCLIVCHDAGGSELVAHWVMHHLSDYDFTYLLEGPAKKIFSRVLGNLHVTVFEEVDLEKFSFVLAGTSWQSTLELEVMARALVKGLQVFSMLDHWTQFERRFLLNGKRVTPHAIWVVDEYAQKIASDIFTVPIHLHKNHFMLEKKQAVSLIRSTEKNANQGHVLYVSEPTSEAALKFHGDKNFYGYDEYKALHCFLSSVKSEPSKKVKVRLHPSEKSEKYDFIVDDFRKHMLIEYSTQGNLEMDLAWAEEVVGCNSMAMVVGVYVGLRVTSVLKKRDGVLPFNEINYLGLVGK